MSELDRIVESTNLDENKLINWPMEQHHDSSQEQPSVKLASILNNRRTSGLAPGGGSSTELHSGGDPSQGSSLSFPIEWLMVLGYETVAVKPVSTR